LVERHEIEDLEAEVTPVPLLCKLSLEPPLRFALNVKEERVSRRPVPSSALALAQTSSSMFPCFSSRRVPRLGRNPRPTAFQPFRITQC